MDGLILMIEFLKSTKFLEIIAVITGIVSVWLGKEENIAVYPVGIISVLIYVYLAYQYKLYADGGVNLYYFGMSVYGWYFWSDRKSRSGQIPIGTMQRIDKILCLLLFSFSLLFIFYILRFTDSDVVFWDATTTALAITAMWLMARKKIEHWLVWIFCDILSIPLYLYKNLWFSSFQFLIFTIIALQGWRSWHKKINNM